MQMTAPKRVAFKETSPERTRMRRNALSTSLTHIKMGAHFYVRNMAMSWMMRVAAVGKRTGGNHHLDEPPFNDAPLVGTATR